MSLEEDYQKSLDSRQKYLDKHEDSMVECDVYVWRQGTEWTLIQDHPEPNVTVTLGWLDTFYTAPPPSRSKMMTLLVKENNLDEQHKGSGHADQSRL